MPRHAIALFGSLCLAFLGSACVGTASSEGASGQGGKTGESEAGGQAGTRGGSGGRGGTAGQAGGGGMSDPGAGPRDAGPAPDAPPPDVGPPPDLAPPAPRWARDVQITLVEIAQGAFAKLGDGEEVVDLDDRTAVVIEGRDIILRAHVQAAADFEPRPLRAVLTVSAPGAAAPGEPGATAPGGDAGAPGAGGDAGPAATMRLEDQRQIAGSSRAEDLTSTFNFRIPAALVKTKSAVSLEIFEAAADGPAPPEPDPLPRFPQSGTAADLGVKAGFMVLDVVLIPARGPSGPLDDAPARRKRLENHLFDVYPVQKLNVRWHETVTVGGNLSTGDAFAILRDLRERENARPYEYYHLLVANEDTRDNLLGIANSAGAGSNQGPRRIAMSFVRQHRVDSVLDTTSHEIGHNHGRAHAPNCNAQGTDDDYPYPNGALGVTGYSLSDDELFATTRRFDLMGYCSPTWISDYTWNGFEARVRAVSAFPRGDTSTPLSSFSLQGFLSAGQAEPGWGLVRGDLVAEGAEGGGEETRGTAVLTLADGRRRQVAASLQMLSDGKTRELAVSLGGPEEVVGAEVRVGGQVFSVPEAALAGPGRGFERR